MDQDIKYWMQGERVQNFGDFLSEYFLEHLFIISLGEGLELRLVGSCIDDMFVSAPRTGSGALARQVFWGCGMREENGLTLDRLSAIEVLSVRGPLSRSALRLGNSVPLGDPGLLLPALHRPRAPDRRPGADLLIPHFHDRRSDADLLALTGCTDVLRPNIANDLSAVSDFIDQVVAADFVLCGSLHGAVTAAAYARPFAFWDSGQIDLPFKWRDFAALLGVPCAFQRNAADGRMHYDSDIAPALRIPLLWPLLVAAPLPVRPDAFIRVLELDLQRHGMAAFASPISARAAHHLEAGMQALSADAADTRGLRAEVAALNTAAAQAHERITALTAREHELTAESARWAEQGTAAQRALAESEQLREQAEQQARALPALHDHNAALQEQLEQEQRRSRSRDRRLTDQQKQSGRDAEELARLAAREAWLAAEEGRLHHAIQDRDRALAAAEAALHEQQAAHLAVLRSWSWRLTSPARLLARRLSGRQTPVRRALRIVGWALRQELAARLAARRRLRQELAALAASSLFDADWYRRRHPDIAASGLSPVAHYVVVGAGADLQPNPMFDGGWYRRTYLAQGAPDGITPLWHYLLIGAAAGHDPHPLFDAAWYAGQHPEAGSGSALLHHYLTVGRREGAAPNRLFHVAGYACEYRDALAPDVDPVQHYLQHGAGRGYDPHPLFDSIWYAAQHPDVAASGLNPLAHYLRIGAAAGYHCTPLQHRLDGFRLDQALALPQWDAPEASIVIPSYGHFYDTVRCLYALMAHSGGGVSFETILIDDNPTNPIAPLLNKTPGLRVEPPTENRGFLRSCNHAASLACGWHLIFLNNDTLVGRDWLEPLLRPVRTHRDVGMVGCKLLNPDGTVQEAGGILYEDGWGYSFGSGEDAARPEYNYLREVDVVVGAAFLVRRDLFIALGGFDDRYAPAFYEEFDLAFAMRQAGYKVIYQPHSVVTHFGSSSYGAELRDRQSIRNHAQFCVKWEDALARQPTRETDLFVARQRPDSIGTLLMIDDKVPEYDRHAGALTIFQYITLLKQLGFRLVFAPADGVPAQPYTARLQAMGVEVITTPARLPDWLKTYGGHLSAIWTARPYVSASLLDLFRRTSPAPILYYPHDLHHVREMRRYQLEGDLNALAESHRVKRLELEIFRRVDCVMTPSAEEAEIIRQRVSEATVRMIPPYLYPTGSAVSLDAASFATRRDLLFVGGFKHPPNIDAALWLVQEIMPLVWKHAPSATLTIVGDEPTEAVLALASDRVTITGYVPDLAPYFVRARLSIAPLRYGAGVKGKIVSSLQAGVPVVTTPVGNEGIALIDGQDALLGTTPSALAEAVLRLLDDDGFCAELSANGAAVIERRFSERQARATLSDILGIHRCVVCGDVRSGPLDDAHNHNRHWSEQFACTKCYALNRTAAVADVLRSIIGQPAIGDLVAARPFLADWRIHEFSLDGPIVEVLRPSQLFTCSEFLDGVEGGTITTDDLMCQDLQHLRFHNDEFDLLISQDVFEHVPDAEAGFREVFRVLKPGGRHIFTVPYHPRRPETVVRAELTPDGIRHLLPPDYHGDPRRPGGALAFRDFGRDLPATLTAIGFDVRLHQIRHSEEPGGLVVVFETRKPPSAH